LASAQSYPHVPIVNYDSAMWLDKALDHLAAAGRRRVAVIGFGFEPRLEARFQAGLAARGMVSHTRWRQFVSLQWQHGARHAAELLMHDRERPDALLVTDDNFVEDAVAGVAAAGLVVPDDVAVVGHANFPVPPAKSLPLRLLGYDAHRAMRACVDLIDRQRRGQKVPGETVLPALWEEEAEQAAEARPGTRRGRTCERVLAAV
jgi:LacI family transcriptional regulator